MLGTMPGTSAVASKTAKARGFRIPSLDGLRAVAILVVFWGHSEQLPKVIEPGVGVTIFFFLSGYLITTLLRREWELHEQISLRDFYLRRVWRILPPLYIVLAFGLVVTLVGILPGDVSAGGTVASSLHFANYWIVFEDSGIPTALRVLWSLAVEEHFYLVFPLLYIFLLRARLGARKQALILAAICIAVLAWRTYLWFSAGVDFDRIYYATDTRLDSILWGCLLAIVLNPMLDREWGCAWFWKWLAAPIAIIVTVIGTRGYDLAPTVGFTMQALAMILLFTAAIRYPTWWMFRWLNWRPVVWLGVMSYCFYLVHRFFILWMYENLSINPWASAIVAFGASAFAAWLLHIWVERPAAKVRHRLAHADEVTEDSRTSQGTARPY